MSLTFDSFTLDHDAATTRRVYADVGPGGADTCICSMCRNWRAIRDDVLPTEFLELLETLGVDYLKDAEVVHFYRREDGLHSYSGWYHAIGVIVSATRHWGTEFDGVDVGIAVSDGTDLAYEELLAYPLVRVSFSGYFPWVLDMGDEPQ